MYTAPQVKTVQKEKVYVDREVEKIVKVDRLVEAEKLVYVDKPHIVEKIVTVPVDRLVEKFIEIEKEKIVTREVEVPVEKIVTVEKIIEVPVDRIVEVQSEKIVTKEVSVPIIQDRVVTVEKIVVQDKVVEVSVDRIVTVEKLVEVPVERIIKVEKVVEVPVEKVIFKDKLVEVEVEKVFVKEVTVQVPVDRIVERIKEVPVDRVITMEKLVEVPIDRIVYQTVMQEVSVDRIVEKIKEVPVDRIVTVEKFVEVEVEKIVYQNVTIEVPIDRVVEKLVTVEKMVQVPVDRPVQKPNASCTVCYSIMEQGGMCEVCPLRAKLGMLQAPTITSHDSTFKNGQYEWTAKKNDQATITIYHTGKDGWQRDCPATVYATIDGSEASRNNYFLSGPSPLSFQISKSLRVRAIALTQGNGKPSASIEIDAKFVRFDPAGVGMLLEKMRGYKGIYIQEVITGGSVWKHGVLQAGDEIKQLDSISIENMELPDITRLILGQAGSELRLKVLREQRDAEGRAVDEQGVEFWVEIERRPIDKDANPAARNAAPPLNTLD